jgi:hypothetical protein
MTSEVFENFFKNSAASTHLTKFWQEKADGFQIHSEFFKNSAITCSFDKILIREGSSYNI